MDELAIIIRDLTNYMSYLAESGDGCIHVCEKVMGVLTSLGQREEVEGAKWVNLIRDFQLKVSRLIVTEELIIERFSSTASIHSTILDI
ncbi:hypothetical protein V6N13_020422 [Hibiscus sabdariffa]